MQIQPTAVKNNLTNEKGELLWEGRVILRIRSSQPLGDQCVHPAQVKQK
jgi:hypothetical protein